MVRQVSIKSKHKVLIGFKCSPSLRLTLCEQAEKIGVSLSSLVETIVSSYKSKDNEINGLLDKINALEKRIEYYENPFLKGLFDKYRGQDITFYDRYGDKTSITVNNISDIFTIIINSFKIDE